MEPTTSTSLAVISPEVSAAIAQHAIKAATQFNPLDRLIYFGKKHLGGTDADSYALYKAEESASATVEYAKIHAIAEAEAHIYKGFASALLSDQYSIEDIQSSAFAQIQTDLAKYGNRTAVYAGARQLLEQASDSNQTIAPPDESNLLRIHDSVGYASTELARKRWAKVLAQECLQPGSVSPNAIRILDGLTSDTAKLFDRFLDEASVGVLPQLVNDGSGGFLGFSYQELIDLEEHGLIKYSNSVGVTVSFENDQDWEFVRFCGLFFRPSEELLVTLNDPMDFNIGATLRLQKTDEGSKVFVPSIPLSNAGKEIANALRSASVKSAS